MTQLIWFRLAAGWKNPDWETKCMLDLKRQLVKDESEYYGDTDMASLTVCTLLGYYWS